MNARDTGLQPERTLLSWRRTAWSMMIPSLLCFRGWCRSGDGLYVVCGGLLLAGALAMLFNRTHQKHAVISWIVIISGLLLIVIILKTKIHAIAWIFL